MAALAPSAQAALYSTGGTAFLEPPVRVANGAFAGRTSVVTGHTDAGDVDVTISAKVGKGEWTQIGTADADAGGDFTFSWKPARSGTYAFRITPAGSAVASADTAQGSIRVYRNQKATWYGPESYGTRTACGQIITKRTLGVAHKTLPCGTKVEFFLRRTGKKIVLPVIDRGPFANNAVWDLTLTAMKRLGSSSTEFLGAVPLSK